MRSQERLATCASIIALIVSICVVSSVQSVGDTNVRSAAEFLVQELNRREASPASTRELKAILSSSDQVLRTGVIHKIQVVVLRSDGEYEISEGSVFCGMTGLTTLMKVQVSRAGPMKMAELGSKITGEVQQDEQRTGAASIVGTHVAAPAAVELDAGFLDGIQVESRSSGSGTAAGAPPAPAWRTTLEAHESASEAVRRLRSQPELPTKLSYQRASQPSRLKKA